MLELNETPVRTAKNFNINNININDFDMPKNVNEFNNVKITNSKIDSNIDNYDLTYGVGEYLVNQVKNSSNKNLKIIVDDKTNKKINLEFDFNEDNSILIDNIEIVAQEDCMATIVIKYKSIDGIKCYHNGIIKTFANKNSKLKIILVNLLNIESNNFISIDNSIEESAKISYTMVDFGAKNSITNYYSNLVGDDSENTLDTIYLGNNNQLFDLNYIGELRGKNTNINIEVQGALQDEAIKHFKGTIDFKRGCKKAKGNENEFCLLLSDKAKSLGLPMLLCDEEEVEGNHASSAGKIGEKELFYIMSRGFNIKEAMKLMVRAKFNKVLENMESEDLKNEIIDEIDKKLE